MTLTAVGRTTEATRKRNDALLEAGPFETSVLADVRWLLCGRGRPVATGSPMYEVAAGGERDEVRFQDIEGPRVAAEERFDELGYEAVAVPWYVARPTPGAAPDFTALRRALGSEELARLRIAGADVASVFVDALASLRPEQTEYQAAAEFAGRLGALGFTTPVLLVGGEHRAPVYRHPLPTTAPLGRFALLAVTAEREGLHTSMTRVVSFGPPPPELVERIRIAAEVDAAVLAACRPGRTLGDLFTLLQDAYAWVGAPHEWRNHHQGGIAGYLGREVFATPGNVTELPPACAVAWNPSVAGGGKSEDTVLVTRDGIEVVTRTAGLAEVETDAGIARPAIVEL